jgi:predicted CXXCH cytochrome family protein
MIAKLTTLRLLLSSLVLGWLTLAPGMAAEPDSSGLGAVAIPQPAKPVNATSCVEPVDVMRREHMNLLLHQRDDTVLDGERDSKYSLTGCMDCHNPADGAETAIRYPDPQHFCAGCHRYASVNIDCFECHADRGLGESQQSKLAPALDDGLSSLQTFHRQVEQAIGQ